MLSLFRNKQRRAKQEEQEQAQIANDRRYNELKVTKQGRDTLLKEMCQECYDKSQEIRGISINHPQIGLTRKAFGFKKQKAEIALRQMKTILRDSIKQEVKCVLVDQIERSGDPKFYSTCYSVCTSGCKYNRPNVRRLLEPLD